MNLVTVVDVRDHLRVDSSQSDNEILRLIEIASGIALYHLQDDLQWLDTVSPIEVPGHIQAAVFLMIGELFLNREASSGDLLSPAVLSLLNKTPGMA